MNDRLADTRRGTRAWRMAAVLAALFLLGHLPFLASTLEDVDSLNFALGIRHFDPAHHRPHPPGYPIYIALGKLASTVMSEPHALSIWGALVGALSAFALLRVFACIDALDPSGPSTDVGGGLSAWWPTRPASAVLLTLTAPLMWMTASRPMSDTAGLAATLAAQALLLTALVRQQKMPGELNVEAATLAAAESGRLILIGAFASAVALGVRSQAALLLLPLWSVVLLARDRRTKLAALVGSLVWFAAGVSLWLVPLVVAAGGPSAYVAALGSQAGEDWSGVDLLATSFTVRRLAFSLQDTFIVHWAGLGWLVFAAAVAGGIAMLGRGRRGLFVVVAAFVPYVLFHLLFQETFTTRYALPLVPPVVYLAVRGLFLLGDRIGSIATVALATVSIALVGPATERYAHSGSPASHALADIRTAATDEPGVVLAMHHAFSRSVEADSPGTARVLPSPPKHEWLQAVKYWSEGGDKPVWFLADPGRTDLALIDSHAQQVRGTYEWPFSTDVYLGGIRPDRLSWIDIRHPGWFAGEGWSLTPETAGVARADRRGLDHGPISVRVRRRPGPAGLMIGGRHLGRAGDPPVLFFARIDGRDLATWTVTGSQGFFLRVLDLTAGTLSGDGRYATLQIGAALADGSRPGGLAAIEQFDLQDAGVPMLGFEDGWQEPEYDSSQRRSWRWASRTSSLRISRGVGDLTMRIAGEGTSPYFTRPSRVVVRAGRVELLRVGVSDDFEWTIQVPAAALLQSDGTVTIETDQVFRPADRGLNADKRELGLRIYSVRVTPAS